jgi:hypothetical protein
MRESGGSVPLNVIIGVAAKLPCHGRKLESSHHYYSCGLFSHSALTTLTATPTPTPTLTTNHHQPPTLPGKEYSVPCNLLRSLSHSHSPLSLIMSKRSSASAANGSTKDATVGEPGESFDPAATAPRVSSLSITDRMLAVEKQKKLLHEATGHFTLIRMLHLADLITELNGSWEKPLNSLPFVENLDLEECTNADNS